MRLSGRVSGDEKQQYVLIDEISEPEKHVQGVSSLELLPEELSTCLELCGLSCNQSTTNITATKFFSREARNAVTGKLEVWRAEKVETGRSAVSSFIKICDGPYSGGIGQIKHFADLKVAEKTTELAFIKLFTSSEIKRDPDSGLCWVDRSSFENKVILVKNISRPIVTAIDEMHENVLWFLNFDNVY